MKKVLILLLLAISLNCFGALTSTYDTNTPLGSDDPAEADDRMRETKAAVQERMNDHNGEADEGDHFWPLTGTEVLDDDTGQHRMITMRQLAGNPSALTSYSVITDLGFLFQKDVSGNGELFWQDEAANVTQITNEGSIYLADARVPNDTYIKAIDNAGTGTVDLIKANTNDEVEIFHETAHPASLSSSDAPVSDADIANKKYVDERNTPFCRAFRKTSTQTLGSGSWTTIQFSNDSDTGLGWDADGIYNTGTFRITPGKEGYYQVNALFTMATAGEGKGIGIRIRKNGSVEIATSGTSGRIDADLSPSAQVSDIVFLDNNDYIEIQGFQNSGGNRNISAGSNATFVSFARI